MKIINTLTLRYLKHNKKRGLLTLFCIIISVTMMSTLGIAFASGKTYYQNYIEKTVGDYHYYFGSRGKETLEILKNDPEVEEFYLSDVKTFYYNDSEILTLFGDTLYFQKKNMNDYMIEGRLPVNKNEIVMNPQILKMNQIDKSIGDQIKFDDQKEYTIVGLMDSYQTQDDLAETYYAITYIDLDDDYSVYVRDKEVSQKIFNHMYQLEEKLDDTIIACNSSYLAIQNVFQKDSSDTVLNIYNILYIVMGIIIFSSVIIIYQAFHLSTSDRIQYLGMLSSVGATPKQKKCSVYFEGFVLSIIAIPIGIFISLIGLNIIFSYINQMELLKNLGLFIHLQISPLYMVLIIGCALLTTLMALYLPARKISKISIIDALTKSDEVKVKKDKLKLKGIFAKKDLKISTQLALKNYKRQGRKSRIIVISLSLSMITFMAMYSFSKQIFGLLRDNDTNDIDVQISMYVEDLDNFKNIVDNDPSVKKYIVGGWEQIKIEYDESYLAFPDSDFVMSELCDIQSIDNETFKQICQDNHIPFSKNLALVENGPILIHEDNEEKTYNQTFKKMDKNFIKSMTIAIFDGYKDIYHQLPLFDNIQMIKPLDSEISYGITFIVCEDEYVERFPNGFMAAAISTSEPDKIVKKFDLENIHATNSYKQNRTRLQLMDITEILVYSFVGVMIFFSFLNVINMMSSSVEKRKKEFAMLMSVGMSPNDIKKMLWKESLVYGLKVLIYSFPICILIEYIFYKRILFIEIPFIPSWIAYIVVFTIIMLIIISTFLIGLNHFKKQNIIEALKDDI